MDGWKIGCVIFWSLGGGQEEVFGFFRGPHVACMLSRVFSTCRVCKGTLRYSRILEYFLGFLRVP